MQRVRGAGFLHYISQELEAKRSRGVRFDTDALPNGGHEPCYRLDQWTGLRAF